MDGSSASSAARHARNVWIRSSVVIDGHSPVLPPLEDPPGQPVVGEADDTKDDNVISQDEVNTLLASCVDLGHLPLTKEQCAQIVKDTFGYLTAAQFAAPNC